MASLTDGREADDVHTYCSEDLRPNVTAEVGGLTIEFTQASCGEAQEAFMEAEQICDDEFERIFGSVDMVHAYS